MSELAEGFHPATFILGAAVLFHSADGSLWREGIFRFPSVWIGPFAADDQCVRAPPPHALIKGMRKIYCSLLCNRKRKVKRKTDKFILTWCQLQHARLRGSIGIG